MGRSLLEPTVRLLNHTEVVYAPGDRALARDLFRAVGCRVLDPQEESGPDDLGAAAGPYLIVFVEPDSADLIDNVLYASEVPPAQWAFEQAIAERVVDDDGLRAALDGYNASFHSYPQGMTHFGIAMNEGQLDAALDAIAASPQFEGRLAGDGRVPSRRSRVGRPPRDPGVPPDRHHLDRAAHRGPADRAAGPARLGRGPTIVEPELWDADAFRARVRAWLDSAWRTARDRAAPESPGDRGRVRRRRARRDGVRARAVGAPGSRACRCRPSTAAVGCRSTRNGSSTRRCRRTRIPART